ncbi:hypothetical protein B0H17DRAFT_1052035 [Mycena rosella]|uniref:Uncharacterized protein n=1 Tax=Mycena rosella TaxID=1033263 RepID=A0AAD7DRK2_MYCRO|nr:hypothetical protein B0H17DRAFT_1052035 [Mycena rosella]
MFFGMFHRKRNSLCWVWVQGATNGLWSKGVHAKTVKTTSEAEEEWSRMTLS